MSRELRRHPAGGSKTATKTRPARPTRATPAAGPGTGQRSVTPARAGIPSGGMRGIATQQWLRDVISELKKVTWPTRQETINLTVVVGVVAFALGLFMGGLDYSFNWIIENTLLR